MDTTDNGELVRAVYGELFADSKTQMELRLAEITAQRGIGFKDPEECAKWAREHLLDILAFSKAQHQLLNVTPRGELFNMSAWKRYFATDLLFWWKMVKEDEQVAVPWNPIGLEYGDRAKIVSERSDGIREPLYHRDYFTPTGFYDNVNETFNVAKPFPVFAKETNRDTKHIYDYIQNLGVECSTHLLAWLRFKCMYPKQKTEVVPIIVSRTQGNGKTTFAEVICKGLFGTDNVIVTDQYDANARFNADYADALVICAEEKEDADKRSTSAALKSRSTGTTIRKENKGIDPIYQESYAEYVVTTNKDVPIRFESDDRQRRFMVMGSNPEFTRDKNPLADRVFSKLYGVDKNGHRVGVPFVEDKELIQQFKHELYVSEELAKVNLHNFPITDDYNRCISMPRTNETTEIQSILRSLAPFILEGLVQKQVPLEVVVEQEGQTELLQLKQYAKYDGGIQYVPAYKDQAAYIALCKPLIFYDQHTEKPFSHAVVERTIIDCTAWLLSEYGIRILQNQGPLVGGFAKVSSRHRLADAARFALASEVKINVPSLGRFSIGSQTEKPKRIGERLRVNSQWKPDTTGEFETVNEMKPGTKSLLNKNQNVQYMDNFLFEADETDKPSYIMEQARLNTNGNKYAHTVFVERLRLQRAEADRLMQEGIAWRVVYSGGKSYHILVRVKDAPATLEEYKWLHAHLCADVLSTKLEFDISCNDPARLTRAPIDRDREFKYQGFVIHGLQSLYKLNENNVFDYSWRSFYQQWLDRPPERYELNGIKLRPSKKIYKDAMEAMLNGTFFTSHRWDRQRQKCFFAGYRLCRLLGFSHEQLWSRDGILDGLPDYYKPNERDYWRAREQSGLIAEIDADVTAQLEEYNAKS